MSEIVMKVAKAICNSTGEFDWDYDKHIRLVFIQEARNAIEAMREPDHDMTAAIVPVGKDRTDAVTVWQAMIDAALK